MKKIKVNEIYHSIQGESTFSGMPCIFIRLTYCNLRCTYCDSEYAFYDGDDLTINEILDKIEKYSCNLVEVTGGEPLLQKECIALLEKLVEKKYEVMLETSGSLPVDTVPLEVKKIIDFKCPSSNMEEKNLWSIMNNVSKHDEIKFVIGDKNDFQWAYDKIKKYNIENKCTILFSPVYDKIDYKNIVKWMLDSNVKARFQIQTHKHIWGDKQGV
tara:strand:+ start:594 stop:1235 length:642 start_codon:yes stop_codon:yes gene_type:complete